jgi:hypothetical protein
LAEAIDEASPGERSASSLHDGDVRLFEDSPDRLSIDMLRVRVKRGRDESVA